MVEWFTTLVQYQGQDEQEKMQVVQLQQSSFEDSCSAQSYQLVEEESLSEARPMIWFKFLF